MIRYRTGTQTDTDAILALMDANVAWLVAQGREAQWGSEAWTLDPAKTQFLRGILASGMITVAEDDGVVVGASVVSDHPTPYVPEIDEPEYFLKLLISSPEYRGQGIGRRLIELARQQVIDDGIDVLRVDCWSGGDRQLVNYYVGQGFTPTEEIEVRPGATVQVFEWRPDPVSD